MRRVHHKPLALALKRREPKETQSHFHFLYTDKSITLWLLELGEIMDRPLSYLGLVLKYEQFCLKAFSARENKIKPCCLSHFLISFLCCRGLHICVKQPFANLTTPNFDLFLRYIINKCLKWDILLFAAKYWLILNLIPLLCLWTRGLEK